MWKQRFFDKEIENKINYQTKEKQYKHAFAVAYTKLMPEGVFLLLKHVVCIDFFTALK